MPSLVEIEGDLCLLHLHHLHHKQTILWELISPPTESFSCLLC